jgi:oxalate decarboxylase
MSSSHTFNLLKSGIVDKTDGGRRIIANKNNFPELKGMSSYYLSLEKGGVREPHWHPNANELTYCLRGKALVTVLSDSNRHDTFNIEAGDLFFVQKGYLHHIQNLSDDISEFVVVFNNELPEDIGITGALGSQQDNILASTFGVSTEPFIKINKSVNDVLIGKTNSFPKVENDIPNDHKFSLLKFPAQIQTGGGTITLGNISTFPILKGLACYYLKLYKKGIREPHWHPNASELDYIIKGRARMNILSPGGKLDTFEVGEGEIVYIPPAYFHYIENIAEEETDFAVFFSHENPEDIGISGSIGAYSNEVLTGLFNAERGVFDAIPKLQENVMVIPGINAGIK